MTSFPVSVTVKNSGGASSSASSVVVTTTGDPWSLLDGRLNAPLGTPQFSTVLNGYPAATPPNARIRWPNLGAQPPWQVAGVDYYVGPDASAFPLKDPAPGGVIAPALSSFCAVADSGQSIQMNGDNHTIDGYDFSLGGGRRLQVQGNNNIVRNCLFRTSTNIAVGGSNLEFLDFSNITIEKCEFDGANVDLSTGTVRPLLFMRPGGTVLVQYCYLHRSFTQLCQIGPTNNPSLVTFQFNILHDIDAGWVTGFHGDAIQAFSSDSTGIPTFIDLEENYNLLLQNSAAATYHSQGFSCTSAGNVASYKKINWTGNTCICPSGSNMNAFFLCDLSYCGSGGQAAPVNGTCTATNNYTDVSANGNPDPCAVWSIQTFPNHGGDAPGATRNNYYQGHFSQTNTVNMVTGGLVTPPTLDY